MSRRVFCRAVASAVTFAALATSGHVRADFEAPGSSLDGVLTRIAAARSGVTTWRAGFVQERIIGLLATKVTSHGQVVVVRPDRLRWQLDAPDSATYWVGPAGISYASPEGHGTVPASERKVGDALGDLGALLGGDLAKLKERYQLRAAETPSEVTITAIALSTLAPPAPGSGTGAGAGAHGLRGFVLGFAPSDLGSPIRATLLEAGKDRSDITFVHPEKNPSIDPSLMRPDG